MAEIAAAVKADSGLDHHRYRNDPVYRGVVDTWLTRVQQQLEADDFVSFA